MVVSHEKQAHSDRGQKEMPSETTAVLSKLMILSCKCLCMPAMDPHSCFITVPAAGLGRKLGMTGVKDRLKERQGDGFPIAIMGKTDSP